LRHLDGILSHHGIDIGLRIARKHIAWSIAGLGGAAAFRSQAMAAEDYRAVQAIIRTAFETEQECLGEAA